MRRLTADQVKIGFIGLGNMGSRIAQRLVDYSYQLFVYDRDLAKAQAFAAQGAVVTGNILERSRLLNGQMDSPTPSWPGFIPAPVLGTTSSTPSRRKRN
jgi:glutamyl-tRNA reductase